MTTERYFVDSWNNTLFFWIVTTRIIKNYLSVYRLWLHWNNTFFLNRYNKNNQELSFGVQVMTTLNLLWHLTPVQVMLWPLGSCTGYNQVAIWNIDPQHHQVRSQPHSPGWARVPLSSFFPQISIIFPYFSSNFTHFLPHFGSPGGKALATPLSTILT